MALKNQCLCQINEMPMSLADATKAEMQDKLKTCVYCRNTFLPMADWLKRLSWPKKSVILFVDFKSGTVANKKEFTHAKIGKFLK